MALLLSTTDTLNYNPTTTTTLMKMMSRLDMTQITTLKHDRHMKSVQERRRTSTILTGDRECGGESSRSTTTTTTLHIHWMHNKPKMIAAEKKQFVMRQVVKRWKRKTSTCLIL